MWVSRGGIMRLLVVLFCFLVLVSAEGPRQRRLRRQNGRRLARGHRRRSQTLPEPPELVARPSRLPDLSLTCPERLTLKDREREANFIFTGRIEWLAGGKTFVSRHTVGAEGVTGGVRVKRVFKGQQSQAGQMIQVNGLGGSHVCNSRARVRDTKIFFTTKDRQGRVVLKSSLVRLTLKNLRTTSRAVADAPYEPRPPIEEEPCEQQFCAWGGECVTDEEGVATCACPTSCPPPSSTTSPVCGTDGNTYTTICELRRHACRTQQETRIRHSGSCDDPAAAAEEGDLLRTRAMDRGTVRDRSTTTTTTTTTATTTTTSRSPDRN